MAKVTVIINTYNRPTLLARAIDSVFAQTFTDYKILVVDDGSNPPVQATVDHYADLRIQYIYQANQGPSAARNTGIQSAASEYIAFLDDDDTYLPHKLDIQVGFLDKNPDYGMVLAGYKSIDKNNELLSEDLPWLYHDLNDIRTWLLGSPTVPSVPLIRSSYLRKVGGFDATLKCAEDPDLWIRLCYAGCRVGFVQSVVTNYLINDQGISRRAVAMRDATIRVREKFYTSPGMPESLTNIKDQVLSNAYLIGAMFEYGAGLFDAARQDLATAVRMDPSLADDPRCFCEMVRNCATGYTITSDPMSFTQNVFQNLPSQANRFKRYEARVQGQVIKILLLRDYRKGNLAAIKKGLENLYRADFPQLFDRGVLSIGVETYLGKNVATALRKVF